jgi:hypothetical protein
MNSCPNELVQAGVQAGVRAENIQLQLREKQPEKQSR